MRVYDVGCDDDTVYLVTDLVRGGSLAEQGLYDQLDFEKRSDDPENRDALKTIVSAFQCPSTPGSPRLVMTLAHNYVGGWVVPTDNPAGANDFKTYGRDETC